MNKKLYIRFGEIPEDERSGVYHAGELVNKEEGVSVYDAKIDDYRKQDKVRDEEIEEYWKNNGAVNEN